jgi:hypothetical protein
MGPAGTSHALAQLTVRRHVPRTLDLGTGCGLQALLAAAHRVRVWAADLNPRALQMVRFNRRLNGLGNIGCLARDLFEPARGLSLDLIFCNPPFVIAKAQGWLHTHSRRPVDDLCPRHRPAGPGVPEQGRLLSAPVPLGPPGRTGRVGAPGLLGRGQRL